MTNETKELLNVIGYNINNIHHVEYINTHPDKYIRITHHEGDKRNQNWFFRKLFGEYYPVTICHNDYTNKNVYLYDIIQQFGNTNKTYYNKADSTYPIYFHHGMKIVKKDDYNNPQSVSTQFFFNWITKEELISIVNDINNSIIQ